MLAIKARSVDEHSSPDSPNSYRKVNKIFACFVVEMLAVNLLFDCWFYHSSQSSPAPYARLVLILAGAVCYIWDFFLVHSYERVGWYQFSTVNHCRLARAQKYRYAKVTTKIAIVPLAFLLIFFCETKSETMGVVRHCLCRCQWPSGTHSSATRLVATLLVIPGALFWRRNSSKGGRYA